MHASGPKDGARMRVAVDGLLAGYISIPKAASMAAYSVPMPKLTPGNHTVVVRKVSEDNSQKSAKVEAPKRKYLVEFDNEKSGPPMKEHSKSRGVTLEGSCSTPSFRY